MTFHLAQPNFGRTRGPLDSPQLAPFMDALVAVNANADSAPGFVWRLQTEEGDATALPSFDRNWGLRPRSVCKGAKPPWVNLSVWESLEALRDFVFRDPAHLAIMRRRREFFDKVDLVNALW